MSDKSVSFKVGAEVVGQPAVDRLSAAVERLRQEQEMLQQRATEVARVAATLTAAEVQAAAAFRSAADAVELKAAAMGLSVGQLHTMEQAEQRAVAAAAALAAQEQRAAVEAAQLAAASSQLTDAERKVAAAMRATEQAAEMKAKALGVSVGQLRSVEQAAQGMAKGTNGAASAAGNLRFQMFDVVQQLSAGQNPMMIANQQGFQIAQAFSAAGQSGATMGQTIKAALGPLAAMGPAAAIVGAAVLALGGAYLVLSRDLDAAIEKMNASAEAATRAAEAHEKWKTGTRSLDEELGLASGELDKYDIMARRMTEAVDGAAQGMLGFHTQQVAAASAAVQAARANEDGIVSAIEQERAALAAAAAFAESVQARKDEIPTVIAHKMAEDGSTKARKDGTDALKDYIAAMQLAAEVQGQVAAANAATFAAGLLSLSEMADAARAAALTEEQRIEATAAAKIRVAGQTLQRIRTIVGIQASAMEAAEAEHQAAVTAIQKEASDARDALRESDMQKAADSFTASLSGLVPPSTLTAMEKLHDLAGKIGQAYAEGAINAEQFAKLSGMVGQAQTGITTAQTASATDSTAGKVGQALSSPLAAAASFHPIAQAVLAGLQSAANMEDGKSVFTDAAGLINDALANLGPFVESAFAAVGDIIAQAPVLLIRAIPSILSAVATGIPKLIGALVGAVPDVIVALAGMIPEMLPDLLAMFIQLLVGAVPQLIIGLIQAFTDPAFYVAIAEAFAAGIERAFAGKDGGAEENMILGSGTTAGGGFQLFGAQIVADEKSAANPRPTTIWIQAGDLWADFGREIGVEESKLGRT